MNAPAQLPPADELYAVRDQIKRLELREATLRQLILSDASARTGNHYLAEVREVEQARTDIKEMRACHPELDEMFDEHTHSSKVTRIVLSAIDNETGEIVSTRRAHNLRTTEVV